MPHIQINRHGPLPDPELVHRHSRVIGEPYPADHTACSALKSTDRAAACPDLAKIHAHPTAVFTDLSKVINAAVDSIQTVRHCVDKTGGQLVVRLSRIRKRRRCHSHFQRAEHIVETSDPDASVFFLLHRQMHCNSHEHFLGRLQRFPRPAADRISPKQQLQTGKCKQIIPFLTKPCLKLPDLFLGIVL